MIKPLFFLCLIGIFLSFSVSAQAVLPGEMLKNPALEARARTLGKELRCLVCQGESIETSQSDFAGDLRKLVRKRLVAGDTDAQVLNFLRARYGDYILLNPPVERRTLALWFLPFLVLAGGLIFVFAKGRRRA